MCQSSVSKIKELTLRLNNYRHEYYNLNCPSVSNAVYDRLFDELAHLENTTGICMSNSPTQTVGYTVVSNLEKTHHHRPLLSLDKTKSLTDVISFVGSQPVLIMHKLDGLTLKIEYENGKVIRASTRGDGNEGEVVTHNISAINGIPSSIPYKNRLVVTGEAYILNSDFEILKHTLKDSSGNPYKNARNLASGSVRCFDPNICSERHINFTPFCVLEGLEENEILKNSKIARLDRLAEFGFSKCISCNIENLSKDLLTTYIEELRYIAEQDGIPIDGIVLTYDSIPYSISCGQTGHHFKDGLALKFEDELYETKLEDIEWTPTRFGEISPVAIFSPVEIDGSQVSRASLHNLTFIRELELHIGCRILISKRNMIIPHVEENLDHGQTLVTFPEFCPSCSSKTRIHTSQLVETLHCDNSMCTSRNLKKFVHFSGKKAMNIEGLSEATLEKFINQGWLHSFMDVYRLNEHEQKIRSMDGFGDKSWQRLWDAIQKSRKTTFERYLISMDIPMIGNTASKELSRYFSGDLNAFESAVGLGFDFTKLNDFGGVLNRNIHEWFKEEKNRILWKELQAMMNIEKKEIAMTENLGNPFEGNTVVVTGKLELFTRDSINAKIESLGAKAGSSVSKNTDFLICGNNAGSKLAKAKQLGIQILTEKQFLEMIKTNEI